MSIYIYKNNQQSGPFEEGRILESLAAGQLSPEDLAIRQGERDWKPLGVLFPNASNNRHSPPPNFANANIPVQTANNPGQKKSGSSKAVLFILLGVGGLFIAAAVSIAALLLFNKPSGTIESVNLSNKNLGANSNTTITNSSNTNSRVSNTSELNGKLKEFAVLKPPVKLDKLPTLKGKVIVVEQRDRENEYTLKMPESYQLNKYGLTSDKIAANLGELETLVQIICGKGKEIGRYGPRMAYVPAYSNVCNVSIIDYRGLKTTAQKSFVNGKKPKTINVTSTENEYILEPPMEEVETYLAGLSKS